MATDNDLARTKKLTEDSSEKHTASLSTPKDPRTKAKYNVLSRLFFSWSTPLFFVGFKRSLEHSDLYMHPSETDSRLLLNSFNRHWSHELKREKEGRSVRLWMVLAKTFSWRFIVQGSLCLLTIAIEIAQSVLVGELSEYFSMEESVSEIRSQNLSSDYEFERDSAVRNAYLFATGLSLLGLLLVISLGHMAFAGYKLSLLSRVLLTSTIYQKILTLSQTSVGKLTIGHVVNLASNDVHRFDMGLVYIQFIWIMPVHLAFVTGLLYQQIGYSTFFFCGVVLLQIPLQVVFLKLFRKYKLKAAKKTDSRVKVMNEVITGIRLIKMYAWENAFKRIVTELRRSECAKILQASVIRAVNASYFTFVVPVVMFLVFTFNTFFGKDLTTSAVFSTLSHLYYLNLSLILFVKAVIDISECQVGLRRISAFLLRDPGLEMINKDPMDKVEDKPVVCNSISDKDAGDSVSAVAVHDLQASWAGSMDSLTLDGVSFTISSQKSLLAVVGSVGSGKSTLLQCLLHELPALRGTVTVNGPVGYVSQDPWIFSATLQQNILFGLPYDSDWYNTVVEACALDKDFKMLPGGDLTLVGERGVTLSGGQKARTSLARAVYRKANVYLLDDPLSAVDAAVGRHLFEHCIRGLLSERCVVLVTHQLQYVQQCDLVLAFKDGCISMYGKPSDVMEVMTDDNKEDPKEEFAMKDDIFDVDAETAGHCNGFQSAVITNRKQLSPKKDPDALEVGPREDKAVGVISTKTYYHYFKAGGGYIFPLLVFVLFALGETSQLASVWWIADWANCNSVVNKSTVTCRLSELERVFIYTGLTAMLLVLNISSSIFFYVLVLRAAQVLHNRMFQAVLRAPVLFFDTNPVGRILNRFSKDVGFMDDILPFVFVEFTMLVFRFFGIMATAAISTPIAISLVFVVMILFLLFRWFVLKTSREIKRLEALARSPLYSHLSTTLQGLPTIRSYCMQNESMEQFHRYQNQHTQAWYLYIVSSRWFGLRVDMISCLYVTVLTFLLVRLAELGSLSAGLAGLALTYAISLSGMFQYCLRQSNEVEALMVSTERLLEYGKLEPEASLETRPPSVPPASDWPNEGQIELRNVSYQHSSDGPLVLKGLSCIVKPREKVGIVGRTGAGKSSLIASLFRLAEPQGCILIDGVDCSSLGLHDLRSKISIIPQDPVLFSGSVCYNLDPFEEHDEQRIWTALDQVQLRTVVEKLQKGLDAAVSEGGTNFSVGQRQLFCLARALLRRNKILVLDEATANVDLETDTIIQTVIRQQFSHCTVLTIAHRLNTVMDSDKIMMIKAGRICEYGNPYQLLSNQDSLFLQLVERAGPAAAQKLKSLAYTAYQNGLVVGHHQGTWV